jgi:histidine triad (HIT) family protein
MSDCIFCNIVNKQIPAKVIYEDEYLIAFNDIFPKAPVHFLVVPKAHIESLLTVDHSHQALLGHLNLTLVKIAKDQGLKGFKLAVNTGIEGGQEVMHLHYHVMGKSAHHPL